MFSADEESRVLEYSFAITAEIYLPASLRQLPYTEQNDSALRTQQHVHRQIGIIAGVRWTVLSSPSELWQGRTYQKALRELLSSDGFFQSRFFD